MSAGTGTVRVLFPIWVQNVAQVRVAFSNRSAYMDTGSKPSEKFGSGTGTGTGEFQDIRYGYGIRTFLRTPDSVFDNVCSICLKIFSYVKYGQTCTVLFQKSAIAPLL